MEIEGKKKRHLERKLLKSYLLKDILWSLNLFPHTSSMFLGMFFHLSTLKQFIQVHRKKMA